MSDEYLKRKIETLERQFHFFLFGAAGSILLGIFIGWCSNG